MDIHFPVYAIASTEGVLVLTIDGKQCVLLFETWELTKAHIEHVHDLGFSALQVLKIPDAQSLREGLETLPSDVCCALFDTGKSPEEFEYVAIGDLLQMIE
jgi:hypothetical protein